MGGKAGTEVALYSKGNTSKQRDNTVTPVQGTRYHFSFSHTLFLKTNIVAIAACHGVTCFLSRPPAGLQRCSGTDLSTAAPHQSQPPIKI